MALYRTGTAAMDAQGVITGTGTKWREPLSLIRTGATIVFLTSPLKLAVISDIVSDTEMKAIQTDGEPVENVNYVILLNDSLTVDGMAQDVAETLRYYQSKETVIEEAIEFFKNFDLKTLQDLVNQIKGDAEKTAADRAATEQLRNETNQIKIDTQNIKDSAVTEITGIKNEALDARDEAENAQFAAEQSKVAADSAKAGAETARDEARQWVQQVNPENLLHKDQNLNDLSNKDLARETLKVEAVNSVKDQATGAYNSFRNPAWTYELRIANNGEWRVARNSDGSTSALSIGAGGTGSENVTQAKINLQINRVIQNESFTILTAPDNTRIVVANNNEIQFQNKDGVGFGLPILAGGTGSTTVDGARHNLGLATNHSPVFAGIDLQGFNGTTSGIAILRNRNADGSQVSYSRVYNELQGGVAKTTIQTTREGGLTNYFQIDENGNVNNVNTISLSGKSISISPTGDTAHRISYARTGATGSFVAGEVVGGAFDTWRDRAAGIIVEMVDVNQAVNVFKVVRWGQTFQGSMDCAIYGDLSCETKLNVGSGTFSFTQSGQAAAVQWINTSDIRLKARLKEIVSGKDKVKSLQGYTYFKRNNLEEDEHSIYTEEAGLIAQDVQSVLPEAVYNVSKTEYLGINYAGVTALLVEAIKEVIDDADKQTEIIQAQQVEIKELKNEIAEMKSAIAEMQAMFAQLAK